MNRDDIRELHYIAPVANLASIMQHGILSHNLAGKVPHTSIAMPRVQEKRENKVISGNSAMLHDFANVYFDARNPMLFRLVHGCGHDNLCVLRVNPKILEIPGTLIADKNAACADVAIKPAPDALGTMDKTLVFATHWTNSRLAKAIRCAEALVKDRIASDCIFGVYVSGEAALRAVLVAVPGLDRQIPVTINRHLFFLQAAAYD